MFRNNKLLDLHKRIKNMKNIFYGLIIVGLFIACLYMLNIGISKTERNECLKWQRQSENIQGFYLIKWQVSQCENYKIEIK